MSDMDPFGNASSSRMFRSKNGAMSGRGSGAGVLGQLSHMAKDVGEHFTGKGKRWAQVGVYLGGANALYGVFTLVFAFLAMRGHSVQWLGAALGLGLIAVGTVGVLTLRSSAAGLKTLYLSGAVVVGLLATSFMYQVGAAVRTDCVLAETFLRLDHLESAIHKVKHEEVINGIMMRLDHMAVEMQNLEANAADKIEEARKQQEFKDSDMKYMDQRLAELADIADRALTGFDNKASELEANITRLEQPDAAAAAAVQEEDMTVQQLKARLRSLKYRQRSLGPRKQVIAELLDRLQEHRISGEPLTAQEYEQIIKSLEVNTATIDEDFEEDFTAARSETEAMKEAAGRLAVGDYSEFAVGDYLDRDRARRAKEAAQRQKYETYMKRINKSRDTKLTSKERYIRSLNQYLEAMPEHCMDDMDYLPLSHLVGAVAALLAAASAYVSLTSTVLSIKKDF